MRWHPAMIRLCIAIHAKSYAYSLLQSSGFIKLPHKDTHAFDVSPGFNFNLLEEKNGVKVFISALCLHSRGMHLSFLTKWRSRQGWCILQKARLFNSIMSRRNLNKRDTSSKPPIATHTSILAIMVRGLFTRLQSPYTPVTPTGDQPATAVRSRLRQFSPKRSEIATKCEIHDTRYFL